jgi:hypothetical protein
MQEPRDVLRLPLRALSPWPPELRAVEADRELVRRATAEERQLAAVERPEDL